MRALPLVALLPLLACKKEETIGATPAAPPPVACEGVRITASDEPLVPDPANEPTVMTDTYALPLRCDLPGCPDAHARLREWLASLSTVEAWEVREAPCVRQRAFTFKGPAGPALARVREVYAGEACEGAFASRSVAVDGVSGTPLKEAPAPFGKLKPGEVTRHVPLWSCGDGVQGRAQWSLPLHWTEAGSWSDPLDKATLATLVDAPESSIVRGCHPMQVASWRLGRVQPSDSEAHVRVSVVATFVEGSHAGTGLTLETDRLDGGRLRGKVAVIAEQLALRLDEAGLLADAPPPWDALAFEGCPQE